MASLPTGTISPRDSPAHGFEKLVEIKPSPSGLLLHRDGDLPHTSELGSRVNHVSDWPRPPKLVGEMPDARTESQSPSPATGPSQDPGRPRRPRRRRKKPVAPV